MSDPDSPSSTDPAEGQGPTDGSSGLSGFIASLSWQVILAATVLALLAAGGVIAIAAGGSDDSSEQVETSPTTNDGVVNLNDPVESDENPLGVEMTLIDGDKTTLRDVLDGKPMVVNFFASWCPPCIAEMPDFQEVSEEVDGTVDFIGVALQDRPEDAQRIIEQTEVTYPWYRDIRGDLLAAFGGIQMPSTVFIDADGTVAELKSGTVSRDELRGRLDRHFGVEL